MRAVLYARVSSREQEQEGFSIPAQQKLLRDYAEKNGLLIVQEFCDVESAKSSGRTQFSAMVRFLKDSPSIKNILVEKTDRLYRNFRDYVLLEELEPNVHLVKEGEILNKDSRSHVKFIHGIKLLMAKNYTDNLSEEVKKGMLQKAEQGLYPSMAPLGYLNVVRDGKKVLEIDPDRAPFIRKLFELYSTGEHSLKSLAQKAEEMGLTARNSRKPLARSYVEYMLRNVLYCGEIKWSGKIYKGIHTPIVSEELFESVRAAFRRHNKPPYSKRGLAYLGLLTCGYCGCAVTGEVKKGKFVYYHCSRVKGRCPDPYVREERLDVLLEELVPPLAATPENVARIKEALHESRQDEEKFHADVMGKLRRRQDELQSLLDRAYEDKLNGKISEEFWERKSRGWQEEQNSILEQMRRHQAANLNYVETGVKIIELMERLPLLYSKQTPHERAKVLGLLLSNCVLKAGKLYPTYYEPFDMLLEMAQSPGWLRR